jgi:SPOR domain
MGTPPDAPDERPAAPVDAEGGNCPRCGTTYEPGQEYCLECGLRLPVAHGLVATLSSAWRRRLPWYPGDWIWPVLLGLVIAAAGAAGAILATRNGDDESATRTQVATGPETLPNTGTLPEEEPPTTDTGALPPPPAETETEPLEPPPPAGPVAWPAGQSGWTVVLASLPEASGRGAADQAAQRALDAGLPEAGVLNSSDYSSLHPGYWVVFSGIYDSQDEAQGALETARATYPQAYARQITQ